PGAPEEPGARDKPSRDDAQRWRAELEREFLQANDAAQDAPAGRDRSRPSAHAAAHAGAPASTHGRADGHAGAGLRQDGTDGADSRRMRAGDGWGSSATASPHAVEAPLPSDAIPAAGVADAGRAMPAPARAPADPLPPPVTLSPTLAAGRASGLRRPAGESATAASHSPAPRYARQLMSLTEGAHASATIRDARLSAAESEKVAHSVSLQLQAAGFGVQRIFINGQRFDSTPTGVAPRAVRLPPLFQDDDA
ncbi:MAG: hypothetical protein JF586_21335, partial [Burkholderiales bacterium]|nr:hypothetical protein [Burkholderiales bacterium]